MEQQKTVLITGGTGTIGSAIVRALTAQNATSSTRSDAGWNVVANYAHDEVRAQQLHQETDCEILRADIADETQVRALFEKIENLRAVVHCAGVSHNNVLARQTLHEWHDTMRVQATGAFLVARESLRCLPRGGRLILLASRVGERGNGGQSAYASAKAATIALVKTAAREVGEQEICVNAVCPGFVPSDMTQNLSEEVLSRSKAHSVFNEFGSGEAVAGVVLWLLGEAAREVSGQVIHCDSRL